MTNWSDMPWTAMHDGGAAASTIRMVEAISKTLPEMENAEWRPLPLTHRMNGSWRCERTEVDGTTKSMEVHTYTFQHLMHVDVRIAGDGEWRCTVRCHGSLISHPDETPIETARIVARLFDRAVNAERVVENRRPVIHRDADLTPAEAVMMVEEAALQGIDATRPFEVERWGPTPLSPSSTAVDQDDDGRVRETDHGAPTAVVRLSLLSGGAVSLQPFVDLYQCHGFDALEMLRMHRYMER